MILLETMEMFSLSGEQLDDQSYRDPLPDNICSTAFL